MFCWSLWAAINLLIPITPQKSCHLGVKKQHLHLVWARILMQHLPLCGHADVTSNGAGWLPFSCCGCWRWPNMERDAALNFSFMVWILKKSWLLFGIFSPLTEQRGDTIMADRRWNTSVATYIGKLFVWIKKKKKYRFQIARKSVLWWILAVSWRPVWFFFLWFLSLILAGFITFTHLGTFCAFIFPIDKKHFCNYNLFYKWVWSQCCSTPLSFV